MNMGCVGILSSITSAPVVLDLEIVIMVSGTLNVA